MWVLTFDLPLISLTKGLFCSQSFSSLAFFSRNSRSFCLWYGPVGALLVWFFIRWLGGRREFWEKNKTHVELSYWFRKIGNSGKNKTQSCSNSLTGLKNTDNEKNWWQNLPAPCKGYSIQGQFWRKQNIYRWIQHWILVNSLIYRKLWEREIKQNNCLLNHINKNLKIETTWITNSHLGRSRHLILRVPLETEIPGVCRCRQGQYPGHRGRA